MEGLNETLQWIANNWTLMVAIFWLLEKIVKLTPTEYDDILIDMLWGFIKKAVKRS
jgi:hypothetical protein